MTGLVIDCSAIIAWFLNEIDAPAAARLTALIDESAVVVPGHFNIEAANALLMAERRGRLGRGEASLTLTDIDSLNLEIDDAAARRSSGPWVDLARKHRLTVYDAAYLELALRRDAELATLDKDLAAAARKEGVALIRLA